MMEWVLVFVLNGQQQVSEKMGTEACIVTMLEKPASQAPYCINGDGKRMNRPRDCEQQQGRPRWCKQEEQR